MTMTLTTAAQNAACDAIVDLMDGGTGNDSGRIRFTTDSDAVTVATFGANEGVRGPGAGAGSSTAFGAAGAVNPGEAILNNVPIEDTSADASGTVTEAHFENRDNTEVWQCNVGTSGTDITMPDNVVTATEPVRITAYTVTVPASP